jgi:hypothetical protein
MLAHGIQLLQCRLSTSFPICLIKQLKIRLNFLHVRVHVKHGIVPLVICDIMCTRSPNTFTLPLENRQVAQRNFYYVVPRRMSIHIVSAWEILAWEFRNLFARECLCNTTLNPCLVMHYNASPNEVARAKSNQQNPICLWQLWRYTRGWRMTKGVLGSCSNPRMHPYCAQLDT